MHVIQCTHSWITDEVSQQVWLILVFICPYAFLWLILDILLILGTVVYQASFMSCPLHTVLLILGTVVYQATFMSCPLLLLHLILSSITFHSAWCSRPSDCEIIVLHQIYLCDVEILRLILIILPHLYRCAVKSFGLYKASFLSKLLSCFLPHSWWSQIAITHGFLTLRWMDSLYALHLHVSTKLLQIICQIPVFFLVKGWWEVSQSHT